jgi:hypothetical protein
MCPETDPEGLHEGNGKCGLRRPKKSPPKLTRVLAYNSQGQREPARDFEHWCWSAQPPVWEMEKLSTEADEEGRFASEPLRLLTIQL